MRGKNVHVKTGEVIFSPFSRAKSVFIIRSGYVIAYAFDDTGKRRIHLIYGPGSYFPVLTTFSDKPQRATYEALCQVVVTEYSQTAFLDEVNNNPEFCREILDKTIGQLEIFADRIINLQMTRAEDKLLHRLESLASTHGTKQAKGRQLPYKLKHHHLADMLGVERETISRALASLVKSKKIALTEQGYMIIF